MAHRPPGRRSSQTSTRVFEAAYCGETRLGSKATPPGTYFPALLHPRRRAEQALRAVVQEAYVHGVSIFLTPFGLFSPGKKHWLPIESEGGYAYMQLDKKNQRQLRAALGVRGRDAHRGLNRKEGDHIYQSEQPDARREQVLNVDHRHAGTPRCARRHHSLLSSRLMTFRHGRLDGSGPGRSLPFGSGSKYMERAELIVEFILGVKRLPGCGVVLWCFRDPITSLINQIKNIKVSGGWACTPPAVACLRTT